MTSPPSRILFVASIGTTLRHFVEPLAFALRSRGFETIAAAGELGEVRGFDRSYELTPFRRRPLRDVMRAYRRLNAVVELERPALLHLHTPPALVIGRLSARRHHVPCIAMVHGTFLDPLERRSVAFAAAEAALARIAAHTIVLSAEDRRFYRRVVRQASLSMAPVGGIGIDTALLNSAVRAPRRLAAPPSIVVLGRLTAEKNLDVVVEAFGIVRKAIPDASLTFVGSPASGDEPWPVPTMEAVFHVPWVDDPYAVLAGSDLVVSASAREGFPMAVMESLALGIPVVAATNRGVREIKRVGARGLTVVPKSAGALGHAMIDALIQHREIDNRTLASKWSQQAAIAFHMSVILRVLGEAPR